MNSSITEISMAVGLLAFAFALVSLFLRYKAAGTHRRMMSMLRRQGLDPEIVAQSDYKAVIKAIRSRCNRCQSEYVCERWLASDSTHSNEFCPNAEIFEMLADKVEEAAN